MKKICDELLDEILRVEYVGNKTWHIIDIGIQRKGSTKKCKKKFVKTDDMPEWLKDRIAVLSMLEGRGLEDSGIYGIGARIDDNSFWVVKPRDVD
jgi:hypothetical protein